MSLENVDRFLDAVKADPALHRSLVEASQGQLLHRAVELSRERGMPFTTEELGLWLRGVGSGTGELTNGELAAVSGGSMLQNSFSQVLKSIGEGISTVARKG